MNKKEMITSKLMDLENLSGVYIVQKTPDFLMVVNTNEKVPSFYLTWDEGQQVFNVDIRQVREVLTTDEQLEVGDTFNQSRTTVFTKTVMFLEEPMDAVKFIICYEFWHLCSLSFAFRM